MSESRPRLSGTGIWSANLRYGDPAEVADAASELESLGFTALWVPDIGGDIHGALDRLGAATSLITIATGILNLWMHEPDDAARYYHELVAAHGDRFLFGIGVSHAPLIDRTEKGRYAKPLARMVSYLDGLDAAEPPLAANARVLAALGPKMLQLARDRTAGAHPYLVTPEHTAIAREAIGPDRLLLPEQGVVLEADPDRARTAARAHLATYLGLPNYANNWYRLGFTEADTADGGSDRLVDALVAWGDDDAVAARLQAHRNAGADHLCIQVFPTNGDPGFPRDDWRRLAAIVAG